MGCVVVERHLELAQPTKKPRNKSHFFKKKYGPNPASFVTFRPFSQYNENYQSALFRDNKHSPKFIPVTHEPLTNKFHNFRTGF